jgi:indoleamine 2,3-dioxygenase
MLPPIPILEDYQVSPDNGFLPSEPPLTRLSDPYFASWEIIVDNLPVLIMNKRVHHAIESLPIITVDSLSSLSERRRAYMLLSFMLHAYVWNGEKPSEVRNRPYSIEM